jgi:hypothetical protein
MYEYLAYNSNIPRLCYPDKTGSYCPQAIGLLSLCLQTENGSLFSLAGKQSTIFDDCCFSKRA